MFVSEGVTQDSKLEFLQSHHIGSLEFNYTSIFTLFYLTYLRNRDSDDNTTEFVFFNMSLCRFPRQLFLLGPSDTAFKEIRVASSAAFRCQFFLTSSFMKRVPLPVLYTYS